MDKYNEKYRFLSKMKNSKRENIIITSAYCLTVNRSGQKTAFRIAFSRGDR